MVAVLDFEDEQESIFKNVFLQVYVFYLYFEFVISSRIVKNGISFISFQQQSLLLVSYALITRRILTIF